MSHPGSSKPRAPMPPPPPGGAPAQEHAESSPSGGLSVSKAPRPRGVRFDAEIEIRELDDRQRPGLCWPARARELSRSSVVFNSRRMCYPNRLVTIAIHRIDDRPVPLFGRVVDCEYEADGMYRVDLDLLPVPPIGPVADWAAGLAGR